MAITIKYDGIEYTVSDPAEAAALGRELKKSPTNALPISREKPTKQDVSSNSETNEVAIEFDPEVAARTLKFLKVIRDSAAHGVQSDIMMNVFEVKHPKAVGSRSAAVNRLLKDMGFKIKAVYSNPKTPTGRIWRPGKYVGKAISTIEQRLAAH